MIDHEIRAYPSPVRLARQQQLAGRLAAVATGPVEIPARGIL
jgi:hypothetical protein